VKRTKKDEKGKDREERCRSGPRDSLKPNASLAAREDRTEKERQREKRRESTAHSGV